MPDRKQTTTRPWLRRVIIVLIAVAAIGAAGSYLFFVDWVDVRTALPPEAEQAFAAALAEAGQGPPYIEITANGAVVHRDQELGATPGIDRLHLLAWSAADQKLARAEYPGWFVRLKTSTSINLGTMIAAARRDWGGLDLQVKYADLARRGPALLLDHRLANGSRIVLWTTAD